LGFANPLSGLVTIDGQSPKNYVDMNPGKIALVPQEVDLLTGTLKSNILLGLPSNPKNVERIKRILGEINLSHFYEKLDSKFDQNFSTSTIQMSGGEKQRIGIARALITNPDIVLLDEATSSLDSLTEKAVTDTLSKLRSTKTIIIIAHRLSTAKSADKIIYLDHGKLIGVGKFEELRKSLPEFAKQAELLGL
jgi:ATP-binding cassette subfamily C protein